VTTLDDRGKDWDADLLAELASAEGANMHSRPCQVCRALESMSDHAKSGVVRALAGTIGERTLAEILTRNGYPTGRRAVATHRREDHTP
jgi:hypothetical protein